MRCVIAVLVFIVGMVFAPTVLWAQSGGFSREAQADLVTKLWLDTCAKHFPNPAQIRVLAQVYRFQENPPYAQSLLAGQKGTVWDVSIGPMAQNALILFDDERCQVRGRRADSKSINAVFEKVLQGINAPGVTALRVSEKDVEQGGTVLSQIAYFVSKTGADQGWAFVATTSDSEATTYQAVITVGRSAKPE